jgi:hypothetical protein
MRHDRGFALLEVIVAAGLLITLAAGSAQIIAAAVREGHASRMRAVATVTAADKIEELRSLLPGDVIDGVDCLDATGTSVGTGLPPPPSTVFIRRWRIKPVDGDPDIVALTVEVSTRDGALRARLVTVRAAR